MDPFVHLHLHTEYSLLDGAARIDRLFQVAKEKNIPAVAMTDHGNMYGGIAFSKAAKEHGIKPIIGCEFYVTKDYKSRDSKRNEMYHLVLLAKNTQGYKNIIKLDSIAFIDGFYYKPRIDMDLLEKHTEGVVCLSACLAGELQRLLLSDRDEEARALCERFIRMFGEDFYIELQDHGIPEQKYVNPKLIALARELGVKMVATNDVHYINKSDAEMHDVLLCVQTGKHIDDEDRMRFSTQEFYLKDHDEMAALFPEVPDAITNTLEVAEKCNFEFAYHQPLLPNYVPADGTTPKQFLRKLCMDGLNNRYKVITPEIMERAEYELGIIDRMGFNEYYLIVWDFINYARMHDIPVGAGRGSGVGSIVAYAVGITNVEPLQYALLFERFLNPERQSMPDFDVDFCGERRGEVIEYVKEKYGDGKVCQIVTFGTMAAKNAIKDVARVYRVPYADVDKITKAMPGKGTIPQLFGFVEPKPGKPDISVPELKEMYANDATVRQIVDMARQLEGMPRNTSKHAAGVVICKDVISDHVPMQRNGEDITTQYNMIEVEELGLLKMDFLGLKTLTDIKKAVTYVKEEHGITVDFAEIGYEDRGTYELIGEGDTDAVFQLESAGMKKFMRDLRPNNLEDIIAGISLYRPGPMDSIPKYIDGKRNQNNVTYKHPMLESILNVTYGCMVYQEQVMQICQKMAGFSFGQADMVRRAMGKKDLKKMLKMEGIFLNGEQDENGNYKVDGAIRRGVPEAVAQDIFDEMKGFASYAFNKSHAAAYAVLAYQTAYLKRYYRTEFICAILNNRITNIEEIIKYVTYCKENGISVVQPDINQSLAPFHVEKGTIRFGLAAIKNVGGGAAESIVQEREKNGPFRSMSDFFSRVDSSAINKRLVESLINGGAFDCLGGTRAQYMSVYEGMMERAVKDKKSMATGQFSLFGDYIQEDITDHLPEVGEFENKQKLQSEKEVLGVYITGHPLEEIRAVLNTYSFHTGLLQAFEIDEDGNKSYEKVENGQAVTMGGSVQEVRKILTKSGREMAVIRLEDLYGTIEVVFFGQTYVKARPFLQKDNILKVVGRLQLKDEGASITADEVSLLDLEEMAPKKQEPKKVGSPLGARALGDAPKRILYLRFDASLYQRVMDTLAAYPGNMPVRWVDQSKKTRNLECRVADCQGLRSELLAVLPSEKDIAYKDIK